MSITGKSTVALLAIFMALLAGAWTILEFAVRPRFEQLEAAAHARDLTRVEENLAAIANDMTARAGDYAHWDDTYAFVSGGNRGFIAANFSDDWFTQYGADFVLFADDNGGLLWSRVRTSEAVRASSQVLTAQFLAEATPPDGAPVHGVVWTTDGPMLYGAARATRSDGTGPARGLVVIARRLDADVLRQQLQLNLRFVGAGAASRELGDRFTQLMQEGRATWTTHHQLFTLIPLRDGNRIVAAVLAEQERDLSALGARTIAVTLLLLSVMFGSAIAALWFLLDRMVVVRLARMRSHFQIQADNATPITRDKSSDEIGQLTDAYNALAIRLRDAVENERRATVEGEAAIAANRMKSDFLANISHELRTPLDAVIGYAELIDEDLADCGVETAREDLGRITAAARHLLTLINEILDLSRIEGDRLEIRPEAFRIDEMLRSVVDAVTPLARAQANLLLLEFEGDLGVAYNDQGRLRQSLINVLAHACKRTHSAPVRFGVERRRGVRGDELYVKIVDTGARLSNAELAGLFELFIRADDNAPASGARLGLAVTRKLLTLMGGNINVTNNRTAGCTFTVIAPVDAHDAALAAAQAAA